MIAQVGCALSSGNRAILDGAPAAALIAALPSTGRAMIDRAHADSRFEAVLTDRKGADLVAFLGAIASREGPIVNVFRCDADALRRGEAPLDFLLEERSLCINTTAAGGNASLMSIG